MSDHLPECTPEYHDYGYCICNRLRKAEQRLWEEFLDKSQREDVYDRGYAAGVTTAREAVVALGLHEDYCDYGTLTPFGLMDECNCIMDAALAAIDALKGEHK